MLRNGKLVAERWYKVVVGDIIKIENDQFVAVRHSIIRGAARREGGIAIGTSFF